MMATVGETHVGASSELLEISEPQERHSGDDASDGGIEGGGSEEGESDGEGSEDAGSDVVLSEEGGSDGDQAEDDDGESSGVEEDEKTKEEDDGNPNAGWAEAMAKILQKKTSVDKPSILTKNKQLDKMKEKEKKEQQERKKQVDKRHAWEMMCREKPDVSKDRETERTLQKIATRGVVQLFNAVRTHQKTVSEKVKEVGGSERKKAKLLSSITKKDFISVLRGTDGAEVVVKTEKPTAPEERPAWSVLRDDFMMGASMKNWDQESAEEEGAGGAAGDSDSGSD